MATTYENFEALKVDLLKRGADDAPLAVMLTPALAQEILDHDPVNRKIREGNLARLVRTIERGDWDLNKSTPIRFLPSIRMADGQHRCRAVVKTVIAVPVWVCVVRDTLGVDEGANRTLFDHLILDAGLPDHEASVASTVTKAICHEIYAPGNTEYLEFFKQNQPFITECVQKPAKWLEEHGKVVSAIFPLPIVATLRARAIFDNGEPAESVDQLLSDAINGGETAPQGSPRRALADQFFKAMEEAFKGRKGKRKDMLAWLLNALRFARENQIKNIVTAKNPRDRKKRGRKQALKPGTAAA